MIERRHELPRAHLPGPDARDRQRSTPPDPIDSATIRPFAQVKRLGKALRHILRMFDRLAIHVHEVQRPVGSIQQQDIRSGSGDQRKGIREFCDGDRRRGVLCQDFMATGKKGEPRGATQ